MQSRFGHDFSRVRVHRDRQAAASAQALDAAAYTVGHDIVFGPGQFEPETTPGRRLIAHELTHVIQQERSQRVPAIQRQVSESFAGIENIPERPLRPHQPRAPELRPEGGELVEGVPITQAACDCEPSITTEEERIDKAIAAFRGCYRPGMLVDALYACARRRVYGSSAGPEAGQDMPAAGHTSSVSGAIEILSGPSLEKRLQALGHPQHCWNLILRAATLKHETQHVEDFDQIARNLGEAFFAEFQRLQGDEERLEKLRTKFPRETAAYELRAVNKFTVGATTALRFELNAYQREKEFYGKVRLALSRVCKPQVPSLGMPALEQQRLYQPRTNFASELVESAEEL